MKAFHFSCENGCFYCDLLGFLALEIVASFLKDHWERLWVNTVDMFYEILKTNTECFVVGVDCVTANIHFKTLKSIH